MPSAQHAHTTQRRPHSRALGAARPLADGCGGRDTHHEVQEAEGPLPRVFPCVQTRCPEAVRDEARLGHRGRHRVLVHGRLFGGGALQHVGNRASAGGALLRQACARKAGSHASAPRTGDQPGPLCCLGTHGAAVGRRGWRRGNGPWSAGDPCPPVAAAAAGSAADAAAGGAAASSAVATATVQAHQALLMRRERKMAGVPHDCLRGWIMHFQNPNPRPGRPDARTTHRHGRRGAHQRMHGRNGRVHHWIRARRGQCLGQEQGRCENLRVAGPRSAARPHASTRARASGRPHIV